MSGEPGTGPTMQPGSGQAMQPVAVPVAPPPQPVELFPGWRGPAAPPTRPVLGAAAAVGLTTAAVLPLGRPGLGLFVAAVAAAVMVAAVARHVRRAEQRAGRRGPAEETPEERLAGRRGPAEEAPGERLAVTTGPQARRSEAEAIGQSAPEEPDGASEGPRARPSQARAIEPVDMAWGLAAVGLAGVAAVRDAEWLVTICLLAAVAAASIAVAGRHFRSLVFSAMAVPLAGLRALPWVGSALWAAGRHAGGHAARTAVAGVVGLLLVALFAPLLASADPAFAQLLDDLLPTVDESGFARAALFVLAAGAVLGSGYLLMAPPEPPGPRAEGQARLVRVEWALPIGLLVALFGLFVGVQFAALFGSDDYVLRTTGLTYAAYARGGFWQLLAVTVLALGVVLLASRYAPTPTPADRAWKRGLLASLAGLTLVIVASAISRMWLYQEAYGFTTLRLAVLTCELWLGACFLLVLVAVLRLRAGPVLRQLVGAGVITLLALAALDPDRFVAEHNVARYQATGEIDAYYLAGLSADAVPALLKLPESQRCAALTAIGSRLARPDTDWRSWNAARAGARPAIAQNVCR